MSFFVVAFVYPLLLAALCVGAGLAVEGLGGVRLPVTLVPAAGFAALIVVSQFAVLSPAIAPVSPWILVVLAACGFGFRREAVRARWAARRRGWWLTLLAAVACYVTVALPVIAAGHLTFPGYLLDTTAGFHLAAGEWMLRHGAPLPPPYAAYGSMLHAYYGNGYPTGGQVLLGVTAWLSGQDLLWLYFPFQVFALSVSALVLTDLAEGAGLPRAAAAFTGWIAAVSALITAYTQMGSIKEIAALPALLLMGAVLVRAREHVAAEWRGAVPFALAAGAAVGAIGPAAVPWIGMFALGALLWALPPLTRGPRPRSGRWRPLISLSAAAGTLGALVVLFSIPTLTRLAASLRTALSFSASNAAAANDPGNLLQPLHWVQAFGIWLGQSHRSDPKYVNETYALVGLAVLLFALGIIWLIRGRRWSMLVFLLGALIVWFALTQRGTEWTNAKVLMLTSPVVLAVALIGAFGDLRANRVQGVLLAGVIGAGVLASDALLYHGTNLAPSARYSELLSIGQRFSGQGPTLVPDFDEYTFYALRKLNIDAPGFASDMHGPFALFTGTPGYGHSYDLDDIQAPDVQRFRLIVIRRSPRWSRPPGDFQLAWSGSFYDVWRRVGAVPLFHLPLGTGLQASAVPSCRTVRSLASRASASGRRLRYALRALNLIASVSSAVRSPDVVPAADYNGFPALTFTAPGALTAKVEVRRGGNYGLWLGGGVDRPLRVLVDGRLVGAPSNQSGDDGNMIRVAAVTLGPGAHAVELLRGGGGIAPGNSSGNLIDGVYLQRVGAERVTVATIPPRAWRSLCGQPLDWIEIA